MVKVYLVFLVLLGLERLLELHISRRNAAHAFARGAIEVGRGHFVAMAMLHSAFLVACGTEAVLARRPFIPALSVPMIGLELLAQGLRYWAVATLGSRWNVRVIIVPGEAAIASGPYRHLRHPNYLAVIIEGVAVPLIASAWFTAVAFTVLNAGLLAVRIRCEERALAEHCEYDARLPGRRRFLPGWRTIAG